MILMNKKVLMIAVVILLLLAGGWYYMTSKKTDMTVSTQNPTGTTQPSTVSNLRDLISKGIAQNCTFNTEKTAGSVYVNGKSVRGDFDTTIDNAVMKSHMIVKDNTSYIWTDGKGAGIKMSFDPSATPAATSSSSGTSGGSFDPSVNMNYKCSVWIADNSKFDLPAGVTFSTFSIPSQAAPAKGTTGSSSQCSYCNALSGDDKTQCLKAMSCN
jgi:hypothetical protein